MGWIRRRPISQDHLSRLFSLFWDQDIYDLYVKAKPMPVYGVWQKDVPRQSPWKITIEKGRFFAVFAPTGTDEVRPKRRDLGFHFFFNHMKLQDTLSIVV